MSDLARTLRPRAVFCPRLSQQCRWTQQRDGNVDLHHHQDTSTSPTPSTNHHSKPAIKDKARKVMETFNISPTSKAINESSFLGKRCIEFTVANFGAAFPLSLNQPSALASDPGVTPTKAFLFSIRSVNFQTQRGETGQAVIKDFAFQFQRLAS